MRRPDFFQVLPRRDFEELKSDFQARPEWSQTVFKDIGMSAASRDFNWSASCSPLSGGCNRAAGDASYRKGDFVPPESLKAALADARSPDDEPDSEFEDYTDEDRREAEAADAAEARTGAAGRGGQTLAGLMRGLGALADGARDFSGLGGEPRGATEGAADFSRARFSGRPGSAFDAPASAERSAPPRPGEVPAPASPSRNRRGGALVWAGLAAAAFVLWRLRRRG
jgi:hypothetical protein